MSARVYLDWNATAPLRPEARTAMIAAMDIVGNPSSVHATGRDAKRLLETARADIAEVAGVSGGRVVFTSGATEAAAHGLQGRNLRGSDIEHDAVRVWLGDTAPVDENGAVNAVNNVSVRQFANSETGILQDGTPDLIFEDAVQGFGKVGYAFGWRGADMAALSAHKIGGPKGIGALLIKAEVVVAPILRGGGQEESQRAGTENLIGIAGFAAAARAAERDLNAGRWDEVREKREQFEAMVLDGCPDLTIAGMTTERLPNTSCLIVPGWRGETQVMQMDLAGFSVSAGSACSSGKVKTSAVLTAMGFDEKSAASAIRVSFGPETTKDELAIFASTWCEKYRKWRARAA